MFSDLPSTVGMHKGLCAGSGRGTATMGRESRGEANGVGSLWVAVVWLFGDTGRRTVRASPTDCHLMGTGTLLDGQDRGSVMALGAFEAMGSEG